MTNEGIIPNDLNKRFSEKMTGSVDLYYFPPSPPCRSVMLLAKALGIKTNLKLTNIMEGDQLQPEFLELNPQHIIPTINDNGFILWESRAILKYFADQYDKDGVFFPKDPKQAAIVNQRLYFDACTLNPRIVEYFFPVIALGAQPEKTKAAKVEEALGLLNTFLNRQIWVAGDRMTIADFAIVASVATAEAAMFDISRFPNVSAWYQRAKKAMMDYGYEEINQKGADMIGGMFRSKLK